MDMSFANQALAAEWLVEREGTLEPGIYTLPRDVDEEVARIKLAHLGGGLEKLTPRADRLPVRVAGRYVGTQCSVLGTQTGTVFVLRPPSVLSPPGTYVACHDLSRLPSLGGRNPVRRVPSRLWRRRPTGTCRADWW